MGHFSSPKRHCDFLKSEPIYEKIIDDCFSKSGELLKKSLILILLGKMIGNMTIKLDFKLKNQFL